jgi:uncharacterized protein (TIGR02611 family)
VTEEPRRQPPKLVRKLQERRATHKSRHPVVRAAFVAVGVLLVVGGTALLVLPGPAFVVIPIGLAILSLEFAWAGRLLDKTLIKADEARRKAERASRTEKLISAGAALAALIAAVVAVVLYDLPGPL